MVSLQNSVARAQIGTVTGAMNFFRALMSSFTVAAFSAILLMALGAGISLGEHRGPAQMPYRSPTWSPRSATCSAPPPRCWPAPRSASLSMEERPLAGPSTPVEMAREIPSSSGRPTVRGVVFDIL